MCSEVIFGYLRVDRASRLKMMRAFVWLAQVRLSRKTMIGMQASTNSKFDFAGHL